MAGRPSESVVTNRAKRQHLLERYETLVADTPLTVRSAAFTVAASIGSVRFRVKLVGAVASEECATGVTRISPVKECSSNISDVKIACW